MMACRITYVQLTCCSLLIILVTDFIKCCTLCRVKRFYIWLDDIEERSILHAIWLYMMTSSNGNMCRVTGHLCGEGFSYHTCTTYIWLSSYYLSYRFHKMLHALSCQMNLYLIGWLRWWRHQMETFSALLAICAGNLPVTVEFHAQRPVTRSFDVVFDLPEQTVEQTIESRRSGFETPLRSLWRQCNDSFKKYLDWN